MNLKQKLCFSQTEFGRIFLSQYFNIAGILTITLIATQKMP
jgi:hypothetical protein